MTGNFLKYCYFVDWFMDVVDILYTWLYHSIRSLYIILSPLTFLFPLWTGSFCMILKRIWMQGRSYVQLPQLLKLFFLYIRLTHPIFLSPAFQASTNILRKYSGPVDIWPSILSTFFYPRGDIHCILNDNPNKSFLAMSQHRSQWIW